MKTKFFGASGNEKWDAFTKLVRADADKANAPHGDSRSSPLARVLAANEELYREAIYNQIILEKEASPDKWAKIIGYFNAVSEVSKNTAHFLACVERLRAQVDAESDQSPAAVVYNSEPFCAASAEAIAYANGDGWNDTPPAQTKRDNRAERAAWAKLSAAIRTLTDKGMSFSRAWDAARREFPDLWDEWESEVSVDKAAAGNQHSVSGVFYDVQPPRPIHVLPFHPEWGRD